MEWLSEYSQPVTALATVGLLIVWVVYAQMFYKDYTRRRRPRIIVDQMSGPGTAASCIVANLSSEGVYIECVLATATFDEGDERTAEIREQRPISSAEQPSLEIVSRMRQGPLDCGQMIVIGTIEELLEAAAGQGSDRPDGAARCLDIRIIATMSSEDDPIGAWKRFEIYEGGERARAVRLGTQQMYSKREKREVLEWLGRR